MLNGTVNASSQMKFIINTRLFFGAANTAALALPVNEASNETVNEIHEGSNLSSVAMGTMKTKVVYYKCSNVQRFGLCNKYNPTNQYYEYDFR